MTDLTAEQRKNIKKNRTVYAKMSLADRLALRKTFEESVNLNIPVLRPSPSEKAELVENIRLIDRINLALQDSKQKRRGMNQK